MCKLYMCGRGIHQQAGRSPLWTPVCQQTFLILISFNAIELLPCATETVQLESALACLQSPDNIDTVHTMQTVTVTDG